MSVTNSNKRVALITGSSTGIGKTITQFLLKAGHKVIGISRRAQEEESINFTHYQCDLSKLDELPEKLNLINKTHPDIDFVFVNAGYGEVTSLEDMSYEAMHEMITVNLTQSTFVTKAFLPSLKKKEHANLVFLSSVCGFRAYEKLSIYCASKFGVSGFAGSIREECSNTCVHVTNLLPGVVKTEFFDRLDVEASDDPHEAIDVKDFELIFDLLLKMRPGSVLEEIVLNTQKTGLSTKPKTNG